MPFKALWQQAASHAWGRATVYLPVALMALLALLTYWLVHSTPTLTPSSSTRPVRHIADYSLRDFTIATFAPEGRLLNQLSGESARHFPDSNTLEIEVVKIKSYPAASRETRASAQKALANGDGTDVRLMGNALIENEDFSKPIPPLRLRGEQLEMLSRPQRLQSESPVVLQQGKNQFTGDRLDYDHLSSVVEMHGRVRGVLQPGATKKAP